MWNCRIAQQAACSCFPHKTSTCGTSLPSAHPRIAHVRQVCSVMRCCDASGIVGLGPMKQGWRSGNGLGTCGAQRGSMRDVEIKKGDLDVRGHRMSVQEWALGVGLVYQTWFGVPVAIAEETGPTSDSLASILFLVAVLGLSVVTIGVAYLSIGSWLDEKQENEDSKDSPKTQYEEDMEKYQESIKPKKSKKKPVERATPKGFGSGKR